MHPHHRGFEICTTASQAECESENPSVCVLLTWTPIHLELFATLQVKSCRRNIIRTTPQHLQEPWLKRKWETSWKMKQHPRSAEDMIFISTPRPTRAADRKNPALRASRGPASACTAAMKSYWAGPRGWRGIKASKRSVCGDSMAKASPGKGSLRKSTDTALRQRFPFWLRKDCRSLNGHPWIKGSMLSWLICLVSENVSVEKARILDPGAPSIPPQHLPGSQASFLPPPVIVNWMILWFSPPLSKEPACNAGDPGSLSGLGRSPGEGNGNPL